MYLYIIISTNAAAYIFLITNSIYCWFNTICEHESVQGLVARIIKN